MKEAIRVECREEIAEVILARPDKLNALNLAGWRSLAERMRALDEDTDLRCVLIRGIGDRAFAAGADISAFPEERSTPQQARIYAEAVHDALEAVESCRHPVIAAIEGVCVGGGLELACAADLRIAGRTARFGIPIKKLGLTMSYPELARLLRLVGPAHAAEILLEGEIFDAGRAFSMGLVNRVVEAGRAVGEAREAAARIAEGAPLVARLHKRFIRRLQDPAPLSEAEREEPFFCLESGDYRRGVEAFIAKRRPEFRGD